MVPLSVGFAGPNRTPLCRRVLRWEGNPRDRVAGVSGGAAESVRHWPPARLLERMAEAGDQVRALCEFKPPAPALEDKAAKNRTS
jgi:hypothetical protein